MTPATAIAADLIRRHEGLRLRGYRDTLGYLTIGYGRTLDIKGISHDEAELMLANDLVDAERIARDFAGPAWDGLADTRKAVLLDLAHQLGRAGLNGFRGMWAALHAGDHQRVAAEMLDSRAAAQSGGRYQELAAIWRSVDATPEIIA